MDKSFLVYEKEYVLEVCRFYSKHWTKKGFVIPSELFGNGKDARTRYCVCENLKFFLELEFQNSFVVDYSYDGKTIVVVGGLDTMKEVTLLFPYEEYDKYVPAIKEINESVSPDGMCVLFVNNNLYSFQSGVCIITSGNYEQIIQLATDNQLTVDYSLGHEEIMVGLCKKQFSIVSLLPNMAIQQIEDMIEALFWEHPKSYYEQSGVEFVKPRKKKLFVSYCHKNKQQVHKIIEELRSFGLDFWLDEEQIDEGENLIDRIDKGMREVDIPIVFLSQSTKESLFAQQELKTFFLRIINQKSTKKKWFIVRLDAVNPDDIFMGLGGFKYFDMNERSVEDLAERLKIKFETFD